MESLRTVPGKSWLIKLIKSTDLAMSAAAVLIPELDQNECGVEIDKL